jgi:hypothetical protein
MGYSPIEFGTSSYLFYSELAALSPPPHGLLSQLLSTPAKRSACTITLRFAQRLQGLQDAGEAVLPGASAFEVGF